jgi:hypothetical protein
MLRLLVKIFTMQYILTRRRLYVQHTVRGYIILCITAYIRLIAFGHLCV